MSSQKGHTNNWATNLKFLRLREGLSQEDLANELNISRSKLNAHENGQTINPTVEDLFFFSDYFRFSIDTLLRINLSKLSEAELDDLGNESKSYVSGKRMRILATTVDTDNREQIEFVTQKARAGYLSGYADPEFISKLPVFNMPHLPKDRKFRMFPTTGDSMYPIPEGSLVIGNYVEDWLNIKEDTPCIVVTRDEGIVFKLVTNQIKKNKTLFLKSLNSMYAPYEVEVSGVLEIWQFVNYISDTIPDRELTMDELSRSLQEIRAELKRLAQKR
jgi:transcriptional regulator with XRE-family HTH domain